MPGRTNESSRELLSKRLAIYQRNRDSCLPEQRYLFDELIAQTERDLAKLDGISDHNGSSSDGKNS